VEVDGRRAVEGAKKAGYALKRQPGRGLSNTWEVTKDGEAKIASVRTTRDRWIAFPPLDGGPAGKRWMMLTWCLSRRSTTTRTRRTSMFACSRRRVKRMMKAPAFTTVKDVLSWARTEIARLSGMSSEAIKLDLRIEA
jgi:hypothetical protein